MNESLITKRYVKAIYQLADEEGMQEKVKADIQLLHDCIRQSPEFSSVLNNPLIKPTQKTIIFNTLFKGSFHLTTMRFLQLVIENKREMYLQNICLHYLQFYKSLIRIKEAIITTAIPLSPKYRDNIYDFFTKKFKMKIELEEKVDSSIIGGFILRVEDQQIDASIKSQLRKIKRELIHT